MASIAMEVHRARDFFFLLVSVPSRGVVWMREIGWSTFCVFPGVRNHTVVSVSGVVSKLGSRATRTRNHVEQEPMSGDVIENRTSRR